MLSSKNLFTIIERYETLKNFWFYTDTWYLATLAKLHQSELRDEFSLSYPKLFNIYPKLLPNKREIPKSAFCTYYLIINKTA